MVRTLQTAWVEGVTEDGEGIPLALCLRRSLLNIRVLRHIRGLRDAWGLGSVWSLRSERWLGCSIARSQRLLRGARGEIIIVVTIINHKILLLSLIHI